MYEKSVYQIGTLLLLLPPNNLQNNERVHACSANQISLRKESLLLNAATGAKPTAANAAY